MSVRSREMPREDRVLGAGVRTNHPVHVSIEDGALTTCMRWSPKGKEQNQAAISPECGLQPSHMAGASGRGTWNSPSDVQMPQHCPLETSSGGVTCSLYIVMLPEGSGHPASSLYIPSLKQCPGRWHLGLCHPLPKLSWLGKGPWLLWA